MLRTCRLDHLCVVRKVYCGKTAERIRMPFGVVSGVGRRMGVLDGGGDRRSAKDSFGDEFGASHNQWDFATRLFPVYFGQDLLHVVLFILAARLCWFGFKSRICALLWLRLFKALYEKIQSMKKRAI